MRNDRDAAKLTFPPPPSFSLLVAVDVCLCAVIETPRVFCWCENKAEVIRRPCDSTFGNLNKTSLSGNS